MVYDLIQQLKGVGGQLNAPDDQPDKPFNTGLPGGVGNEIGNPISLNGYDYSLCLEVEHD